MARGDTPLAFISQRSSRISHRISPLVASSMDNTDCGCNDVVFAGEPSDRAKSLDARQAIRNVPFKTVDGETVTFDQISSKDVVITVLLRSLG
jgi:hypothetical protein